MRRSSSFLLAMALGVPATAVRAADDPHHAVGTDLFFSTDAEKTEVFKVGLNLDLVYRSPEKFVGVRLERASFRPLGQSWQARDRAYLRAADSLGSWKWNAIVGTDGDAVLGSAGIHDEVPFRKEFSIEREILETPEGLKHPIYYTFATAAIDLPADERNVFTVLGGVQEFTGRNVRTHLRANFVHVVKPGLSVQLRTRYFHDSVPGEFDYYSPRWYVQAVPIVQLRRFTATGWRYLVAGGIGAQRDSSSGWRRASYFNAQVTSPAKRGWAGNAAVLFNETPTTSRESYSYLQFTLGVRRAF